MGIRVKDSFFDISSLESLESAIFRGMEIYRDRVNRVPDPDLYHLYSRPLSLADCAFGLAEIAGSPDDIRLIDLGCGHGFVPIAFELNGIEACGIDHCADVVEYALGMAERFGVEPDLIAGDYYDEESLGYLVSHDKMNVLYSFPYDSLHAARIVREVLGSSLFPRRTLLYLNMPFVEGIVEEDMGVEVIDGLFLSKA